jgi:predicted nucleic acid-binding protein
VIVVDTNAVVHLLLGGQRTESARRTFSIDPEWAAPILWRSEFRSVLSMLVRRQALPLADAIEAAREAELLLSGREFSVETQTVLELAESSGCTAYDCEFVALASDLRVPLVTSDREILEAFPTLAVAIDSFAPKPRA